MFKYEKAHYVIPDVIIDKHGDEFVVRIMDDLLSNIKFNHNYFNKVSSYQEKDANQYLQEKKQDYYWIIRSLNQRQQT
ncbi:MAG: hypothetical protein AB2421_17040, partial [Thermotaleaceae bacterium]